MSGTSETLERSEERATWAGRLLELLGPQVRTTPGLADAVRELLLGASQAEAEELLARLASTGKGWDFHEPQSLARRLSRVVVGGMLDPGSGLAGSERLERTAGRRVVLVGNHLSFVDANVFEYFLAETGFETLGERLAVVVGPKVFSTPLRRIASLCFGTLKTPQSSSIASGEAVMSPREVARTAAETMQIARSRLESGSALLLFVEGTRSRSGAMQRALAGIARYLDRSDALVVPFGLWGSERLIPLDSAEQFHRARVRGRIGTPVEASELLERCNRRRALVMDTLGFLIAACLPAGNRGVYSALRAGRVEGLEQARKLASGFGG
jgi:1-acyl-sn-glycerol-3-phosphate acyltransferase